MNSIKSSYIFGIGGKTKEALVIGAILSLAGIRFISYDEDEEVSYDKLRKDSEDWSTVVLVKCEADQNKKWSDVRMLHIEADEVSVPIIRVIELLEHEFEEFKISDQTRRFAELVGSCENFGEQSLRDLGATQTEKHAVQTLKTTLKE